MRNPPEESPDMTETRPVLAVTMGDPAGIGPEIAVRALLAPEVRDCSRSFLIGDARVFERALSVCDLSASLNRIAGPEAIADRDGVIDVVHQDTADPRVLQMGKVQALGGEAAYAAIRTSIDLAMAGRIAGVATTPINKESLKAAKIPFIGHTEMFAEHTGAREEMTMFTISGLKIFFLTRHLSLIDACRQITRDRTLSGIEKAMKALHQLGIDTPHLAVAALNPHGGEDGLFGREEMDAIKPAIEAARSRGMHVSGPVPADSVFHMARIGRYDAVLSLYHDQGHIAAKMMDFEKTVSVTLGLPILRTSVDHGTAFDIAGTGRASAVSMIEAIKVAAEYVVRGVRLGDDVAQAAECDSGAGRNQPRASPPRSGDGDQGGPARGGGGLWGRRRPCGWRG
jgi:4-hydroxythreonine-4-phosphate dehydrogenase